jgi:hypothetical protein
MIGAGKNRIMIFGPKDDGTYVVEFRTAECAGDFDSENRGACHPAFPGADALWAVRAGGDHGVAAGPSPRSVRQARAPSARPSAALPRP